ncbi:MAG: heavy metal-binding domain-containing protein [Jatrophihabitantaceae bacterium]
MSAPQPPSIPTAAQGRLHHSAQPGAAVTSFLTYSEYLMLDQMGLEPIGAVVGLSVMHLGRIQLAGITQAVELEAYSQFLSAGRLAAIGRMQDEAAALGADGIITQTVVTERRFDAEEHEYSIRGTAVRFRPQPGALRTPSGRPFVFVLAVQTLYQMLRVDMAPVSYGYGVCVYHVPHRSMRQAFGQTFQNVEVPMFTDAWYTAREIALSRLQAMHEQQGAQLVMADVVEEAEAFGEHTAEFRAFGTGWVRREGISQLIPPMDATVAGLLANGVYVIADNPVTAPGQPTAHRPPAADG